LIHTPDAVLWARAGMSLCGYQLAVNRFAGWAAPDKVMSGEDSKPGPMSTTLDTLAVYLARIAPGLILGAAMLYLARREALIRIAIYLAMFILLRDAMTPLGLWSFGTQGFFWIRLHGDPAFLAIFGVACLGLSLAVYFLDRPNQSLLQWTRGRVLAGLLLGGCGAVVVIVPLFVIYQHTSIESRGGQVPLNNVPAILVFALLGNLLEEALFRGYVYGQLAHTMSPLKAGIASGVVFSFCHIYLAITVTDAGYALLVFTLWEGMIAGIVGAKSGVLPATLTHGGAIFLLSSGLI
jgi:membrane protease YdiL (CAAX protease family)